MQQRLLGRITDLLDVSVAQNDGLPGRKCKRKLERLEKAAEELDNFNSETKHSYSTLAPFLEGNRRVREIERSMSQPAMSTSSVAYREWLHAL